MNATKTWTQGAGNLEQHRPLLYSITKRMTWAMAELGIEEEDLIQEGFLGLIDAAKRFDPERGVKFITYAFFYARVAMQRYIARERKFRRVPTVSTEWEGYSFAIDDPDEQQPMEYYLKFLPADLYETFRCLYAGMNLRQTGEAVGVTKTAVAERRKIIYALLREALYP